MEPIVEPAASASRPSSAAPARRFFEVRHVVGFEETNLVGNVYFLNYLRWQGRCREMFLREHYPSLLEELETDLALITTRCSCEYLAELKAFDELSVRMVLEEVSQSRIAMAFTYWRIGGGAEGGAEEMVAIGRQEVALMRRDGDRLVPARVPRPLRDALRGYSA